MFFFQQVKLEPGHGARLAMFSCRFNKKNKETCIAVTEVTEALNFPIIELRPQ